MIINTFDIDGVINFDSYNGIYPGYNDLIITGRSVEESFDTLQMLKAKGIRNQVYFNPLPFSKKTRKSSGTHKGKTIKMLIDSGFQHGLHFEDDEIQIEEILKIVSSINIVHVKSNLIEKENVKRKFNK